MSINPWALEPRSLLYLEAMIKRYGCRKIIECGSGESTLLLQRLKRQKVIDNWVSLEHERKYYDQTRAMLKPKQRSNVLHCPLVDTEYGKWYDVSVLNNYIARRMARSQSPVPFDFILVDGPPGQIAKCIRRSAPYLLEDWCSLRTYIFLDDLNRPHEQAVLREWVAHPSLKMKVVEHSNLGHGYALIKMV